MKIFSFITACRGCLTKSEYVLSKLFKKNKTQKKHTKKNLLLFFFLEMQPQKALIFFSY